MGPWARQRWLVAVVLVSVLGVVAATVFAADDAVAGFPDVSAVDRFVDQQMNKHRIPGISLVVFEDGEMIYAKGYGTAGHGRPMTPDTPMIIGSTTKSFTAVSILQLVEQGLVDLDSPVSAYLPWFRTADPVASTSITTRHLLNHTSGLSELGYNRVLRRDATLEQGVRDLQHARLTAPVGTTFQYFNPNYAILALIIETVSGQSYADYVTEHIFRPLGMMHSYAGKEDAPEAELAQGHSKLFGFPVARQPIFRAYMLGAGYIVSTAHDLSRFLIAMDNGGAHDGGRILSSNSVALMASPPAQAPGSSYGMGWSTWSHRGEPVGGHGGSDEVYACQTALLKDRHRGYALLMNQQHLIDGMVASGQLQTGMLDLLIGRQPAEGGISMKLIGIATLAVFLISLVTTVRSFVRMRGWGREARSLTARQMAWRIAQRLLIPALTIIVLYRFLGSMILREPRAWNFRVVGAYSMPDIALLLLLAIVPDLVQGIYMTAVVMVDRFADCAARPGGGDARRR
ncbi:MAG: serine hydrolase domain-containing protein [Clostridia bacterium]|nr:serine hydrolase domain-containing protein [Clostridia bacterium]